MALVYGCPGGPSCLLENYTKGEVTGEDADLIPFSKLDDNFVHMKVQAGSKLNLLLSYAIGQFKDDSIKQIVFSGSGNAITKTVTCVEIMKRKHRSVYQITRMGDKKIEEFWDPKLEGLDRLKVTRLLQTIHILLSKSPLDENELGYQKGKFCPILARNATNTRFSSSTSGEKFPRRKPNVDFRTAGKKRKPET
uniref:DNA/RNA-binding protein Alba-like domain-containing protein n=1 Tax=Strigamia maritima TaxID=126957 RepID=T1JAK3_STRMM